MTAGNNGASKPEDDDPFGYLYADGQAAGAQPPGQGGYGYPGPAAQPGVPRTSYNQVRTVGERQYGQHRCRRSRGTATRPSRPTASPRSSTARRTRSTRPPRPTRAARPPPSTARCPAAAVPAAGAAPTPRALLIGGGRRGRGRRHRHRRRAALGQRRRQGQEERGRVLGGPRRQGRGVRQAGARSPRTPPKPVELPKQDAATLTLGGAASWTARQGRQGRRRQLRQPQRGRPVGHLDGRCAGGRPVHRCT